ERLGEGGRRALGECLPPARSQVELRLQGSELRRCRGRGKSQLLRPDGGQFLRPGKTVILPTGKEGHPPEIEILQPQHHPGADSVTKLGGEKRETLGVRKESSLFRRVPLDDLDGLTAIAIQKLLRNLQSLSGGLFTGGADRLGRGPLVHWLRRAGGSPRG